MEKSLRLHGDLCKYQTPTF